MINSAVATFLFTDIEGSTQLWEQHPEAMQAALARHDAILRQAIETHGGHVFKTVGDAFCAAFSSAPDAVSSALDAQRAIQSENWGEITIKVRMGLHSGAAEVRDNDYFGPPLNRVARLMSAGHGGQTLLSAITRELAQPSLPKDTDLRDMGERGLKDLIRPEHIYQLTAIGLQTDFPPLKTLEAFRTNLPAQLTSFIGREKEIVTVKSLITEHRLTTLTGSGGTGKTRLSLQVAADLLDSFPAGVWFVEFAPLADPALVPQTVLTTLGLREEMDRPVLETLTHYLQTRKVLLILDNCEHLVEAAAQFAEAVLQACPNLRLLVSSREALGIPGEKAWHVTSLSIPNTHVSQSVETIRQYEAVLLFVDRAQTAFSGFTITNANVAAVAQICSRLDGIPLAIELAAARVKMLKVEQIAERLDDRFRLLTGGSRTALPRQQTLRAMIDWSYDLLPESERVLLRRLSVFAGGWTLEAAETVCQGPGIDDYNVLDPLAQLVNKSLVVVDADTMPVGYESAETRYRLLETVRQYVREKLSETGEGMAVRDLHLQYFLGLAERAEPELTGPRVVEWMKRLDDELDNIRAALEWSLKQGAQAGLQLACALRHYWFSRNLLMEGIDWLSQLLRQPAASTPDVARAKALTTSAYLHRWGLGDAKAQILAEQGLMLYRALGDQRGVALALHVLGGALCSQRNYTAGRPLMFESLALYKTMGDTLGISDVLNWLGSFGDNQDYKQARAYLDESLALCRTLGHTAGIRSRLRNLGHLALEHGDYLLARTRLTEALEIQRSMGAKDKTFLPLIIGNLGTLAFHEGNYEQAYAYFEESLLFVRESGGNHNRFWLWDLANLGHAALRQDSQIRARSFLIQAQQGFKGLELEDGVVYALEGLASLALAQGQLSQVACIFAWADATRQAIGALRSPAEQADIDRNIAAIHAQLDEASFAAAQTAGRAMSMDEAIALALESTHD
jgi:predicted ATPase/class 3 adenylate cyclase